MTQRDIKLVIEAFFAVNKRLRTSYNSDQALKYAQTDKYYKDILEVYNELNTRTDALIEKACKWLENNLQGIVGGSIYIDDFKNYMKGE